MTVVSLFVLVVLLVLVVLVAMFEGCCGDLLRVVMYAWRLSWSCLGVCDRCSYCPLRLRLCCLVCLVCLFWVVMYEWRFSWACLGVCHRCSSCSLLLCL